MNCNFQSRQVPRSGERGWALLVLLLAMALLIIFAAAIVPSITFQMKRDREEEMIHRGVQYSRAIRAYYKKFGRYPVKIEDLENTSHIRFLRKRYKDPLNCKNGKCEDFKLLHFGEVQLMGGGMIAGATPVAGMNNGMTSTSGFGQSSGFSQPSTFGSTPGLGMNPTSSFAQNQPSSVAANQPTTPTNPSIALDPGSQTGSGPGSSGPGASTSNPLGSGKVIGGAIIGVASVSKEKTIREFNHKNKYKDWFFVYDPTQDLGRLITTPYQPQLQGFGTQNVNNPQTGPGGVSGPGFGNPSGYGNSPSPTQNQPMQNQPTTPQQNDMPLQK